MNRFIPKFLRKQDEIISHFKGIDIKPCKFDFSKPQECECIKFKDYNIILVPPNPDMKELDNIVNNLKRDMNK